MSACLKFKERKSASRKEKEKNKHQNQPPVDAIHIIGKAGDMLCRLKGYVMLVEEPFVFVSKGMTELNTHIILGGKLILSFQQTLFFHVSIILCQVNEKKERKTSKKKNNIQNTWRSKYR
uniref:Uncharacterized protein n=1 Tax=Cacopsylla melanoneura TaxID=428564 RepID=A0A8D8QJE6_9HEMI